MTEINWRLKSAMRKREPSPELKELERKLDRMSTILGITIFILVILIILKG